MPRLLGFADDIDDLIAKGYEVRLSRYKGFLQVIAYEPGVFPVDKDGKAVRESGSIQDKEFTIILR